MAKKIVKKNDKSEVKEKLLEAENVPNDDKKRIRKKNRDRARKQENWFLFILIIILLACFAAIGFLFYKYFYAGASSNKYGDRLDGIESYPLPENLESKITELYASEKSIDTVKVDVKGKIIYVIIGFKESVKADTAKSLAVKSLDAIGESNLTFYDVQFILKYTGTEENENFPMFGSKSSNSLKVVW